MLQDAGTAAVMPVTCLRAAMCNQGALPICLFCCILLAYHFSCVTWTPCSCIPPQRACERSGCQPLAAAVSSMHNVSLHSSPFRAEATGRALPHVSNTLHPCGTFLLLASPLVLQMRDFVRRRVWKRSRITWALAQELAASGAPSAVPPGVPSVVPPEAPSATSRVPPEALPMDPPGNRSGVTAPDGRPYPVGSGQAAAPVAAEAALGQVRRSKGCLVSLPAIWIVCGADSLRPEVCQQQINAHADFQHEVPEPRPACCGPEPANCWQPAVPVG